MNYYESAEGIEINLTRAYRELDKHGIDRNDPDFQEWASAQQWPIPATDLLDWLGY